MGTSWTDCFPLAYWPVLETFYNIVFGGEAGTQIFPITEYNIIVVSLI
jgi:hypothetical protein